MGVPHQRGRILVGPAPAERIVYEMGGIASEKPEVRQRRPAAEKIGPLVEMRAQHPEPGTEHFVHPELDVLRRDADRR